MSRKGKNKGMTTAVPRSFSDFKREEALAKGKAKCQICKLPPELYTQVKEAKELGATHRELIDWLSSEHATKLVTTDFLSHASGGHDPEMRGRS